MEYLKRLMKVRNLTKEDVCQMSGVPDSTLRHILNGESKIDCCQAGTLCCIAAVLNTTVEQIIDHYLDEFEGVERKEPEIIHDDKPQAAFYSFLSGTMNVIHNSGLGYVVGRIRERNLIRSYYANHDYRLALLMLGLTDFYHRTCGKPIDPAYNDLRHLILDHPVYSLNTINHYDDHGALENAKHFSRKCAIPELARHNIYLTEGDIRLKA